jgi:hypothetical protein
VVCAADCEAPTSSVPHTARIAAKPRTATKVFIIAFHSKPATKVAQAFSLCEVHGKEQEVHFYYKDTG